MLVRLFDVLQLRSQIRGIFRHPKINITQPALHLCRQREKSSLFTGSLPNISASTSFRFVNSLIRLAVEQLTVCLLVWNIRLDRKREQYDAQVSKTTLTDQEIAYAKCIWVDLYLVVVKVVFMHFTAEILKVMHLDR